MNGKVALVTGGTRGIGGATALALASAGADVCITGRRNDAETQAVLAGIAGCGKRGMFLEADYTTPSAGKASVEATVNGLGGLDVLVHCAGGPANGGLLEISEETWHTAFQVHVHSIFHLCRAAVPVMKPRGGGAIVLVSSTAGIRGIITNVAYQVAKGALPQFARALAREFANDNIRVNCVAPGVIRTAFHASMTEQQRKLNLEQRIPLHREGTPDQVATVILELARNDYITGETMTIDGGLTMRIA